MVPAKVKKTEFWLKPEKSHAWSLAYRSDIIILEVID